MQHIPADSILQRSNSGNTVSRGRASSSRLPQRMSQKTRSSWYRRAYCCRKGKTSWQKKLNSRTVPASVDNKNIRSDRETLLLAEFRKPKSTAPLSTS